MKFTAKKLETTFIMLFNLSFLMWLIQDYEDLYEQIAIAFFSLYLLVYIYNCNKILMKSKPDKGSYYRYKRSFTGLNYYWLIPVQVVLVILDFQGESEISFSI